MNKEEINFLKYVCSNAGHSMDLKDRFHLVLTSENEDTLEILLDFFEPDRRDLFELYNRRPKSSRRDRNLGDWDYTIEEAYGDLIFHHDATQTAMRNGEYYNNAFAPNVIIWAGRLKGLQDLAQARGIEIEGVVEWREVMVQGYQTTLDSLKHIERFQESCGEHFDVERELHCAAYMLGKLVGEIDPEVEQKVRDLFQRDMFVDGEYKDPKVERSLKQWRL